MPVKVIIQNASAGTDLRVNGEEKPDLYRFTRNPNLWSEHELVFATAEEFNAVSADLMRARGNPPMHVIVTPDEDAVRAKEDIECLSAKLAESEAEIARLRSNKASPVGGAEKACGADGECKRGRMKKGARQ